ncbi:hypothetical protein BJY04DRAFT_89457 [Aspergillus karnatakaensis]|uniref:uncharacterized protein n=1 Tax=Aspergillus karnatakaensis TaxID=1810916 RepID=UPI003CCE3723
MGLILEARSSSYLFGCSVEGAGLALILFPFDLMPFFSTLFPFLFHSLFSFSEHAMGLHDDIPIIESSPETPTTVELLTINDCFLSDKHTIACVVSYAAKIPSNANEIFSILQCSCRCQLHVNVT